MDWGQCTNPWGRRREKRADFLPVSPELPWGQLSPRPDGSSRKLLPKTAEELLEKGILLFCVTSVLWAMLFMLKVSGVGRKLMTP